MFKRSFPKRDAEPSVSMEMTSFYLVFQEYMQWFQDGISESGDQKILGKKDLIMETKKTVLITGCACN